MFKATVENRGDAKYFATTRHAEIVMGTEGNGANPIDTLLASLCGCMGHYVRDYLVDRQLPNNGFAIAAQAGVTPDRSRLAGITVSIDLKGVRLDERQAEELLQSVEGCKVHKILKENPGVSVCLAGHL